MKNPSGTRKSQRRREPGWAALGDADLLKIKLKDLNLSIEGTWLADCLADLNAELSARELEAQAHGWLSDEWFSPHTSPGVAFPFYLAHPRLMRLERKMVLDVEGGTVRECMKILRHEAGHVVQYAYGLHRRKRWQDLFGHASKPYPEHYRPNPASKNYVQHLRRWYAQSHPDEDFAETFAVWLTPRAAWRKKYADWPTALKKLQYVDELMAELAGEKTLARKRVEVDPLRSLHMTLGDHYRKKLSHYAVDAPTIYDRDLQRIFSAADRHSHAPTALGFMKRNRAEIRRLVSYRTGEYQMTLEAMLDDVIDRSRVLKLRAPGSQRELRTKVTALLTDKAMASFSSSSRRQWFAI